MKNRIVATAIVMILMLGVFADTVNASNYTGRTLTNRGVTYHYMEATAYCINGRTATGTHTRKGICAGSPEHFGEIACVYKVENGLPGEFIGYFEVQDTGGTRIRNGEVLDLWFSSYEECIRFGRKDVVVVYVKGVG